MNKANSTLTQERLKEVLHYDSLTGVFTWVRKVSRKIRVGDVAGTISHGYIAIRIDGIIYLAHRLAWLWVHGVFPQHQTDHINRDKSDNRIANLREATACQNAQNRRPNTTNQSGVTGVAWYPAYSKWRSRIGINGKQETIGYFSSKEDAHNAYLLRKKSLHEFH